MKQPGYKWLLWLTLVVAPIVHAIDPRDVRDFGDVFAISAEAPGRDRVEVSWDIAPGYYLYQNDFLAFESQTSGVVLGTPRIPTGERQMDTLLGKEVTKFHHHLTVELPLVQVPARTRMISLRVRSQGCQENVLCYPPTEQLLVVSLPPAKSAAPQSGPAAHVPAAGQAAKSGLLAGPAVEPPPGSVLQGLDDETQAGVLQNAGGKTPALPADQAFRYEAIGLDPNTVLVRMTAQPGYYLYLDKFAFHIVGAPDISIRSVELPDGALHDDPEFGPVPVVYDVTEIPVHLNRPPGPARSLTLEAEFQGCRDGDICYPPQKREVTLSLDAANHPATGSAGPSAPSVTPPVPEQNRLARLLLSNPGGAMLAFFIAGILLALTPCVFPMLPILSGIIVGEGARLTTARALTLSLVYVGAMALTYTAAGVIAGMFGENLQILFQSPWVIGGMVLVFVLLALSMFGLFELQLPGRWQTRLADRSNRMSGGRLGGVAAMGFLSALIVGPCVAPPLAAALIVIGSSGSPVLGGAALFFLSLGMGVPLVAIGASAGKWLPRAGPWMAMVKAVFGVGLLALSVWLLQRILPPPVILLLWGALAIGSGIFLGALERLPDSAGGMRRLWKALGLVLLILGGLEIIGAATGGDDWLKPLARLRSASSPAQPETSMFRRIKSLDELHQAVAAASAAGRPVMLDFYADWCVECLRMERNTFPQPEVRAAMQHMVLLQADVTANDATDQALMTAFGVIGPPATLFFDRNGQELQDQRLFGYFDPDTFTAYLKQVVDQP